MVNSLALQTGVNPMTNPEETWKEAFDTRDDLKQYGDCAIGLFALALRFGIDDLDSVAAESITDGNDDKKCDLIYLDREEGVAIVAQCYFSSKRKESAPANKASDLNTAIAWLLLRPISELPERIKSQATALRSAIQDGELFNFEVWYVHNLPESKNVKHELETVNISMTSIFQNTYPNCKITTQSKEIGIQAFENLYTETLSPILIDELFTIEIQSGFKLESDNWKAYVTAIPARFLYNVYKKKSTLLFSANVRDYLGSRKSDANINNGIKTTAESSPKNFWVFNNGITVLTHSFEDVEEKGKKYLNIRGISIVNGAQTTGAIGSLSKAPDNEVKVPARFVQTSNTELINDIIQYNNSQNKITASDFRSTDRTQKRLRNEVEKIPNAKYEGGRRGGYKGVIERNKYLLPSYTVGQSLAAFHQDPVTAYNHKSEIWVADKTYSKYFNDDTTGEHIIFCYSLLRSVEENKRTLIAKSKSNEGSMTTQEKELLAYFRYRGSTYLFVSAIASCLETLLGRKITNYFYVSFGSRVSPKEATQHWIEVVHVISPFSSQLREALTEGLKSLDRAQKSVAIFRSLVQATSSANAELYKRFSRNIIIKP